VVREISKSPQSKPSMEVPDISPKTV